jgi:hypothetical protein
LHWLAAFTVALVLTYGLSRRPLRYGLAVAGVVVAGIMIQPNQSDLLHRDRNFFGVKDIVRDTDKGLVSLVHGGTVHGAQSLDPARRTELLTYYTPSGPLGDVFHSLQARRDSLDVGVLGLGAGAAACYARAQDNWTFYEIDPQVVRIARDPALFTYLRDCTPNASIVLGDARLSMEDGSSGVYDLLILDAYSSDAIPVHLITREALDLYLEKLADDGWLAFHISNKYFDLEPVLSRLAEDAELAAVIREDTTITREELDRGKTPSVWLVMARSENALANLPTTQGWRSVAQPSGRVWTDDYSSLLSVLDVKW